MIAADFDPALSIVSPVLIVRLDGAYASSRPAVTSGDMTRPDYTICESHSIKYNVNGYYAARDDLFFLKGCAFRSMCGARRLGPLDKLALPE